MTSRNGRLRCHVCSRSFKPKRSDARYCSPACRQAAHRSRSKEDELVREIEATRLRYWRLIAQLEASRPNAVTDEAQYVDENGNVFMHGEHVGKTTPHRGGGWHAWGLEAAGPPWQPPPFNSSFGH